MGYWDSIESAGKKKRPDNRPPLVDPYQLVGKPANSITNVNLEDRAQSMGEELTPYQPPGAPTSDDVVEPVGQSMGDDFTPTPAIDAVDEEGEYLTTQDDLAEDFNRGYLEPGASDTTDEEAYINQRISDQLGADQVGARARMGRAGFGSSGALAAMEGDQMRQANLDAEGRIYDVREREQNQTFDQGVGVQEIDIRQQEAADRLAQQEMQNKIAQELLGGDVDPADTDGDGVVSDGEADEQARSDDLADRAQFGEDVGVNYGNEAPPDAAEYNEWPNSGEPVGFPTGQDDEWYYVYGLDTKLWKVRK